jgi:hypothetical protein
MQIVTKLFDGSHQELTLYNGQAILDKDFYFSIVECYDGEEEEEDFTFPGYTSAYFRVFNERTGREIKDLTMSRSGAYLILNASVADATFDDLGPYYYEIGYMRSGYEQVLRYGKLNVI